MRDLSNRLSMLVCCFNLSCLPGGAHKIAPRGAADLRACAESCWSRCIVCPRLSARHIAHGDGGKRGSHGAAGQHPYSTSSAPHTALALAVLLHPSATDARVLAQIMMPTESLATPQWRCYSILTTPPMHLTPLTEARHTFALTFHLPARRRRLAHQERVQSTSSSCARSQKSCSASACYSSCTDASIARRRASRCTLGGDGPSGPRTHDGDGMGV